MSSIKVGFNINAAAVNQAAVLDIVRRLPSRVQLVMHGVGFAKQVYDEHLKAHGFAPLVICRDDYPDGDWRRYSISDLASEFKKRATWDGYVAHFLNEPIATTPTKMRELLDACMRMMDECERLGVKCVIGNFADAATFDWNLVQAGMFDTFLRHASDWTRAGNGWIGHHNYTYGLLWMGGGGRNEWDMLHPERCSRALAPTKAEMTTYAQTFSAQAAGSVETIIARQAALYYAGNPHVSDAEFVADYEMTPEQYLATVFEAQDASANWTEMRYMFPLLRCDALGIERYKGVVTEGKHDDMPHSRVAGISPAIEQKYVGGTKLRGTLDQRKLWPHMLPGYTEEQAFIEQLKWWSEVQPDEIVGCTLFTLSGAEDWASFDLIRWPAVINAMAAWSREEQPVNYGMPVKARINDAYRLRADASTSAASLTTVPQSAVVNYYPASKKAGGRHQTGNQWLRVDYADVSGWMADQGQFAPIVDPAPTKVLLPVPFATQRGTGLNNCAAAVLAMVLRFWAEETKREALETISVGDVDAIVNTGDNFAGLTDIQRTAAHYDLTLHIRVNVARTLITTELDAGRPVIALVERGKLPGALAYHGFGGAHFVVVIGYSDDALIALDPLAQNALEGTLRVSNAAWDEAHKATTGNSGKYQVLTLDSKAFDVPEPTEEYELVVALLYIPKGSVELVSTALAPFSVGLLKTVPIPKMHEWVIEAAGKIVRLEPEE